MQLPNNLDELKTKVKRLFDNLLVFDDKIESIDTDALNQFNETIGLHPIGNFIPHHAYDADNGLFYTKNSKCFMFKSDPYVGVDESIVHSIHQLFQSELPVGSCGQVLLNASSKVGEMLDEYVAERSGATPMFQKIAKMRAQHTKAMSQNVDTASKFLVRDYNLYWSFAIDNELGFNLDEVLDIKNKVKSSLTSAHLELEEQGATDFVKLASDLLRPTQNVYFENNIWDPLKPLNHQLVDSSYFRKITSRRVMSNDADIEIFTFRIKDYPLLAPQIWDMAKAIGDIFTDTRMLCPFSISLIYKVVNADDVIKGAEAKAFNAEVREKERRGRSKGASIDSQLWREILSNKECGEKMLLTNFQIQLYCKRSEASQHIAMLANIFQSKMKWVLERNDFLHMPMLLAHLPMSQTAGLFSDLEKLNLVHKLWAMNVANIVPVIAEMKGANSKKVLLAGRRGQIMFWDPFAHNRGNYNVAVVGGSGAGKSVFIQEAAFAQLSTGGRVWVVDVGRSYYKMTKLFDGQFVVFNEDSNICLNPFSVANTDTLDSFFKFMTGFIYTMAFPGDTPNPHEGWCKATISQVVHDVWYAFDKKGARPDMQDVIDVLAKHQDARAIDMAVQLFPFGRSGNHGKYFNGTGKLNFDGDFIVFELEEVSQDKHLQNLIFILLIHYVTEKMYLSDRKKRMSLIIDEAWDMLKGGHGGEIIESIARRARKYNGNLWTGTQGVHDYNASPAARAAWNNSYWQALLSQDKSSITKAVKDGLLELEPFEERLMKDVHTEQGAFSEILLRGKAGEYAIGRFMLDPFSKAVYSTQAAEFSEFNELINQGKSALDAISIIAKDRYGANI